MPPLPGPPSKKGIDLSCTEVPVIPSLCCFSACCSPFRLGQAPFLNSFGPDDSFQTDALIVQNGLAVATGSINGLFHSVRLAGQAWVGPNDFQLILATNNNGLPGSPIETIDFSFPTRFLDDDPTPFTIFSNSQPQLFEGSIYWLIVQARDPSAGYGVWYLGEVDVSWAFRSGNQWVASGGVFSSPALQVFVTPNDTPPPPEIPEPSTMGLLSVALVFGALGKRFASAWKRS